MSYQERAIDSHWSPPDLNYIEADCKTECHFNSIMGIEWYKFEEKDNVKDIP